ncbi:hypothetical protein [Enterovibrio calviensis]|uniref:nuclear transport factor 2 family protein n=1 Tax=Enterovibrio calviensis TaxID=91359 RepID=UPI003734D2E7
MNTLRKQSIHDLLKGIETGDPESVRVVDQEQYIQHNPLTKEGDVGLAELFARLAKTNPRVEIIRIFSDGNFVFAHTEYDFSSEKICFEVFRFEGERTVEHWDNLQLKQARNASGHSMIDGETQVKDQDQTESNRQCINAFVKEVLIERNTNALPDYVAAAGYVEHNPALTDDIKALSTALLDTEADGSPRIHYQQHHRTLADGNFVLSVCEGYREGIHSAFYDLFRLDSGLVVEHWDTVETVPPRADWNNLNGKF